MKVFVIAQREFTSMFSAPLGWIVLSCFLLVTGLMWTYMVESYVLQSQDLVYNPAAAGMLNLSDYLLAPYYGNAATVLLFLLPAVTMRTFAHEFRLRTYELLATSPVGSAELVAGKYLACMGFLGVLLLIWSYQPAMLAQWGDPEPGVVLGAYLGLLLMGSLLVALGMFLSSLTSSQSIALVVTFATSLILFILNWSSNFSDPDGIVARVALAPHLSALMSGAVRLSDVAYFVLGTATFLFATHQRLESFRWS